MNRIIENISGIITYTSYTEKFNYAKKLFEKYITDNNFIINEDTYRLFQQDYVKLNFDWSWNTFITN